MNEPFASAKTAPLIIRPTAAWWRLNLAELWQFREMLYFMVWRNIKVRYKQTLMGVAWAVIQPFCAAVVFTVFFGVMAKLPSDGVPYLLFSYSGLVPWTYFSGALILASSSLVSDSNLIRKIYFPRLILPVTACLTGWVDFFVTFLCLLGMMFYNKCWPGSEGIFAPVFLLLATLTALSVSLWLSALDVKYHDVRYTIPFVTQIWMFLSPVICSVTLVRDQVHMPLWVYGLNPMASVIIGFRWSMGLGPVPDPRMMAASCAVVLVVLATGLWYFKRTERFFADVI